MNIDDLRKAVEYFKKVCMSIDEHDKMNTLLSLAEAYLSAGSVVEKREFSIKQGTLPAQTFFNQGWNACCDAQLLQGYRRVPSISELKECLDKEHYHIINTKLATAIHALCEGRNK